jgi:flagellar P-ring protein precursor FlgI
MSKQSRLYWISLLSLFCFTVSIFGDAQPIRIKDIATVIEARENQLFGFGLVVGLRNTGDSKGIAMSSVALNNFLKKMGVTSAKEFSSNNVASVVVTAALPPYAKKGQKIPVTVSSLGDSTSLVGGTLLVTPLQGADMKTYAVAQGAVIVGGMSEQSTQGQYVKNQSTVGRIPEGAIVEAEVPVTFADQLNITIVFKEPNFSTITKASKAIQSRGFPNAKAIDANTIKVPLSDLDSSDLISTIAKIETITFIPDSSSKIVINPKTGTVVIGEMVRLFPVAVTHGNISVKINNINQAGGGLTETQDTVRVVENDSKMVYLNPTTTLSSLVNALNELGATPKDLISILQALQESGSLIGTLEIL